jgi:hypothetical protein
MDGGAMQDANADHAGPLEHPDDPPNGAPGPLALDAQDLLGNLGADRATPASIGAIVGKKRVKAAVAVGVVPRLDRAGRELDARAVRPFMEARGGFVEIAAPVAVLEARTRERPEHPHPPERDRLLVLMSHGRGYTGSRRPFLGGS